MILIDTDLTKEPAPRPRTNPADAMRMGAHGGFNAALSSIEGMTLSDWLNVDVKHLGALLLKFYQAEDFAEKRFAETLKDNPIEITTGKRKQRSADLDDEIPNLEREQS